jgi:hypothetical protein
MSALSKAPSSAPSNAPTQSPSDAPTLEPSQAPSDAPSQAPTELPTGGPTNNPTSRPTREPSQRPTKAPSNEPTLVPSQHPSAQPTLAPTNSPTAGPTPLAGILPGLGPTVSLSIIAGGGAFLIFVIIVICCCCGCCACISGRALATNDQPKNASSTPHPISAEVTASTNLEMTPLPLAQCEDPLPPNWIVAYVTAAPGVPADQVGVKYYFNQITGASEWTYNAMMQTHEAEMAQLATLDASGAAPDLFGTEGEDPLAPFKRAEVVSPDIPIMIPEETFVPPVLELAALDTNAATAASAAPLKPAPAADPPQPSAPSPAALPPRPAAPIPSPGPPPKSTAPAPQPAATAPIESFERPAGPSLLTPEIDIPILDENEGSVIDIPMLDERESSIMDVPQLDIV